MSIFDLNLTGEQGLATLELGDDQSLIKTGIGNITLDDSILLALGNLEITGTGYIQLDGVVLDDRIKLDDVVFTGIGVSTITGVGIITLSDSVTLGNGLRITINGSAPYVCSPSTLARVLSSASSCTSSSNATPKRSDLCTTASSDVIRIGTGMCTNSNIAIHKGAKTCSTITLKARAVPSGTVCSNINIGPSISSLFCSSSSATSTTRNSRLCATGALSSRISNISCTHNDYTKAYYKTRTTYTFGEPYTPTSVFIMGVADTRVISVPTVVKAIGQTDTFIMTNDSTVEFVPEFVDNIATPTNRLYDRITEPDTYKLLFNEAATVVDTIGTNIANNYCTDQADARNIAEENCTVYDTGVQMYRNTCQPIKDILEVPPPIIVDPTPPSGVSVTIPTQDEYTMNNTLTAVTSTGTEIPLSSFDINLDTDSATYSWSASLADPSIVNSIKPHADGTPVIITVTLNGVDYKLLVEKIPISRVFNSTTVSISGRSISAQLDTGYQLATNVNVTTSKTNQQLADMMLPNGWSINWELDTWLIPANTYSHINLTPLQAISKIAADCGGVVIPHKTNNELTIKPRYPVLPWNFSTVTPDLIVPDSVIIGLTEEPTAARGANGVKIYGGANGSQALVKLTGTTGTNLINSVSNNLMVNSAAIRKLGERALAAAYTQPKIRSITTFMDSQTVGTIDVCTFIEFSVDGQSDRGVVNSTSLSVGMSNDGAVEVSQSVTIGEASNNDYVLFAELLPEDRLHIVTLANTIGSTEANVTTVDGNSMVVRGTGTPGQKYYVRGGAIEGLAPNLINLIDIEV